MNRISYFSSTDGDYQTSPDHYEYHGQCYAYELLCASHYGASLHESSQQSLHYSIMRQEEVSISIPVTEPAVFQTVLRSRLRSLDIRGRLRYRAPCLAAPFAFEARPVTLLVNLPNEHPTRVELVNTGFAIPRSADEH